MDARGDVVDAGRCGPLLAFGSTQPGRALVGVLAGTVLLVPACVALGLQRFALWVALLLVAGLVILAVAVTASGVREELVRPRPRARSVRLGWLAPAVVLTAGTWASSGTGVYTRVNVPLWFLSLACWLVAWWPGELRFAAPRLRPSWTTLLSVALVLALAAFLRFHLLHEIPGEPTSDHAEKLLDVREVIRGDHPIYFPGNGGREPAQFYVSAALVKWFGLTFSWQTLKLGTAAVGVLAVGAIFFLGRELGGPAVATAAATLAAVSRWPLGDDRLGLRFPYAILASALTLLFLLRYLHRGDRRHALAVGVLLGLGLHGYATYRVWLVAAALFFVVAAVAARREGSWQKPLRDGVLAYATAFVAAVPLVHYAVQHPDLVFDRMSERVTGPSGDGTTLGLFLHNTWNGLLAFHWRGDIGWPVSVPGRAFLDPVTGALLLAGVAVIVVLVARRSLAATALLLCAPVLLLSSTLNLAFPIENPSANRLSVAVPLVFTVAALPVGIAWSSLATRTVAARMPWGRAALLAGVLCTAALAWVVRTNYVSYFHDYPQTYLAQAENTSEVAAAIAREHVARERTFMIGYPYWLDGRNLALALGDLDWYLDNAIAPGATVPAPPPGGKVVYALAADDVVVRRRLERRYPTGSYRSVRSSRPGQDFGLFVVPGSENAR